MSPQFHLLVHTATLLCVRKGSVNHKPSRCLLLPLFQLCKHQLYCRRHSEVTCSLATLPQPQLGLIWDLLRSCTSRASSFKLRGGRRRTAIRAGRAAGSAALLTNKSGSRSQRVKLEEHVQEQVSVARVNATLPTSSPRCLSLHNAACYTFCVCICTPLPASSHGYGATCTDPEVCCVL